ncbi:type I polyketide synthase [Polyangium sp. y55x31]|uniref:type I polyketide synthase n=1 Tax=Polyangium sp. y55x31 TaxID=3042688 RepID=UPI002482E704|nr:type I polyketide synthase [Polyangium sp. y55x31]MDI1475031.1 SDR family NAD(P)-dependent oxidoreductase [Polyangium sp. y55x31]
MWLQVEVGRLLGLSPDAIGRERRFRELGLESAPLTALVARLSSHIGRPLLPTAAWEYPTIEALSRYAATSFSAGAVVPARLDEKPAEPTHAELNEPIAIIGMACRLPGGVSSPAELWKLLREGRHGIREVPPERWDIEAFFDEDLKKPGKMSTRWGGFVDGIEQFDAPFFSISRREGEHMDPQQRIVLELAWEAIEDARMDPAALCGRAIGVFVGAMWSDYARLTNGNPEVIEQHTATGQDTSIISARVSYTLGLEGPSLTVNTACSSSLMAIHLACQSLRLGESTMALAGGVHIISSPHSTVAMTKLGAMNPAGQCRAFDADANGYVRGEGGGLLLLKPLRQAIADGDPIYCVIRGSATNNDGFSNGLTAPNPKAQEAMLRRALVEAGVDAESIDYIETHGPGTILGDPIEAGAIGAILGASRPADRPVRIGSIKTNFGHLEAAAGVAGLMKVALSLRNRMLPPSLNYERPNPHIPFDALRVAVQTKLEAWPRHEAIPRAGVSSFGFGGTNCHAILEAAPGSNGLLLALAAHDARSLRRSVLDALDCASQLVSFAEVEGLCRSVTERGPRGAYRGAVAASSREELVTGLSNLLSEGLGAKEPAAPRPRLVFVCPGHGGQWVGMARSLVATEPVFRAEIEACDRALSAHRGFTILGELLANEADSRLDAPEVVQAVMFGVSVALAALWRSWGIEPDVVVGHSMGEVTAAYLAGVLSLDDAVRVIAERSRWIGTVAGRGGVLSVVLPADQTLEAVLRDAEGLALAAVNGPRSVALSGAIEDLERAEARLSARGIVCQRVKMGFAAHGPQMDPLLDPLRASLVGIMPHAARVRFRSTALDGWLDGAECSPEYWAKNLRNTVLFERAIAAIASEGPAVFLELGPHPVLLKPIERTIQSIEARASALPSCFRYEDERASLLKSLGALFQAGFDPRFSEVFRHARGLDVLRPDLAETLGALQNKALDARAPAAPTPPIPLVLSGKTEPALRAQAARLFSHLSSHAELDLRDVAHSLATTRTHFERRAVVVAREREAALDALQALSNGQRVEEVVEGRTKPLGKVVFVFPGQGSQWVGMALPLLESSAVFRAQMEQCERALAPHTDFSILSVLRAEPGAPTLDRLDVVQPVLFAMMVSLAALWRSLGVEPDAVVGHSQGEIAAAYVSGALSLEDAARVVGRRSRALTRFLGTGAMATTELSREELSQRLARFGGRIEVAAVNGPRATSVSGDPDAVEELVRELSDEQIFVRKLHFNVATHYAQMEVMQGELSQILGGLAPKTPSISFYSTVTGDKLEGPALDEEYWYQNLRKMVRFADATERLIADGHRVFIEVNPHPLLAIPLQANLEAAGVSGLIVNTLRREHGTLARVLSSWAELFTSGVALQHARMFRGAQRAPLPTYPFQRERYWLNVPSARSTAVARAGATLGHPLLGAPFRMSVPKGTVFWEQELSSEALPWLRDHCVEESCVFPGAGYVEMGLAAAREVLRDRGVSIEEIELRQALVLTDATPALVQITLEEAGPSNFRLSIAERQGSAGPEAEPWRELVSARVGPAPENEGAGDGAPRLDEARARCVRERSVDAHYESFSERGHRYGPAFRGLRRLFRDAEGRHALGQVALPDAASGASAFLIHPALLDACIHVLFAAEPADAPVPAGPLVPVKIDRVHGFRPASKRELVWCEATVSARRGAPGIVADLCIWEESGALVGRIDGLHLEPLGRGATARVEPWSKWLLGVAWRGFEEAPRPPAKAAPGRWLVLSDQKEFADAIAAELASAGGDVEVVLGRSDDRKGGIDPLDRHAVERTIADSLRAPSPLRGVICAWGLDAPAIDEPLADPLAEAGQRGFAGALHVAQSLAARPLRDPPRLVLVTQRSQSVHDATRVCPEQALAWGLGGTIRMEHPNLRPLRVDIGDPGSPVEVQSLISLLLSDTDEDQIALRGSARYVARLEHAPLPETSPARVEPAGDRPYRLANDRPGVLDGIHLAPFERTPPGEREVEIEVEVAGINFRDVLSVLGEIPAVEGRRTNMGLECVGRVARLGPGVTGLHEGQRVIAVGFSGFATHVLSSAVLTFPLPEDLAAEDAVTLPIAHLTAYHSLCRVAKLRAGERVLIHSAAGGVGMAALAWARHAGAEIIATAGTEEKCAWLRSQGVRFVTDSRSDRFVEDVLRFTGGEGVDVVLNSLGGPFLEKSLDLLREGGRFVELGRRDYQANHRIGLKPFLKGLTFSFVDLGTMIDRRPELVRELFLEILEHVRRGEIRPLPHRTFPLSRAQEAFWEMRGGKHTGKLVLRVDESTKPTVKVTGDAQATLLKKTGSYLITGGLGGLGLSLASWMAERGAGHLVLVGRRGPQNDAQREAIEAMRRLGAEVTVAQVDVSDRAALAAVVASLPAAFPLKGVVHAAMVLDDGMIPDQSITRARGVFGPKVAGAVHLDALTRDMKLDFFVLYSSAMTLLGSPGQANYTAANAFLDALAHHRRSLGLPTSSIAWGPFAGIGLAAASDNRGARLEGRGLGLIDARAGHAIFARVAAAGIPHVAPCPIDVRQWADFYPTAVGWPYLGALFADSTRTDSRASDLDLVGSIRGAEPEKARLLVCAHVLEHVGHVLRMDPAKLDPSTPFRALGVDSLIGLELRNRLEASTGQSMPATIVWTYPTANALTEFLLGRLRPAPAPEPRREATPVAAAIVDKPAAAPAVNGSSIEDALRRELEELEEVVGG